ncbi:MAG TPA: hypothetical protein VML55_12235 [Planctomycetaceae bacterium]|nr:hypothetical protein [Planctomycetaceae bacterium]
MIASAVLVGCVLGAVLPGDGHRVRQVFADAPARIEPDPCEESSTRDKGIDTVTAPRESLELDDFYRQYLDADGFPIVASIRTVRRTTTTTTSTHGRSCASTTRGWRR